MEFFPLAAVGVGMAAVGTLLLLFLVMIFRTRLTSANSRGPGNQPNNSHPLEKPNSLMLTSGNTTNNTTSSATYNSTGYRALPQSKIDAEINPDIIPGPDNFSTDTNRTLSRKGMFQENGHDTGGFMTYHPPPEKSNFVKDYPPPHYPANNYIYMREKLHDDNIPESCV